MLVVHVEDISGVKYDAPVVRMVVSTLVCTALRIDARNRKQRVRPKSHVTLAHVTLGTSLYPATLMR